MASPRHTLRCGAYETARTNRACRKSTHLRRPTRHRDRDRTFQESLAVGEMLPSMREGVVSLLYKKGRAATTPPTIGRSPCQMLPTRSWREAWLLKFAEVLLYLVSQNQAGSQS